MTMSVAEDKKGVIARTTENSHPVILKLVNELPSAHVRKNFPWLTVISWKYDANQRNGMPDESVNLQMVALEDAVRDHLEAKRFCRHAYSRTGNGLKELVYYIEDRDQFMDAFNDALKDQPHYPIDIDFFEDQEWKDFQRVLGSLKPSD